ncbi:MAG: acetylglutamate kinase [Dehalococcoidales bacterium]|nr:acetylglutamate kinase [Dehalococcoidales bacterium]
MSKSIVVKIGGSTLGQHDTTLEDLVHLQRKGIDVVVVHGGGKTITSWLTRQGASTRFVGGERVTDRAGLDVASAVLCGLVNKELVAGINNLGGKALGLSGADGLLLKGDIKKPELGYVGIVSQVNSELIGFILGAKYIPVIAPVSFNCHPSSAGEPLLMNVNADAAAGEIAASLGAAKLIFLTDIAGVCDKSGEVLTSLTAREAEEAIVSGIASGGMVPKIRAGIRALEGSAETRIIDGRQPHALLNEIYKSLGGTTIHAEDIVRSL